MLARTVVPNAWEAPNDLENSEDCRSAGGHGNQHVRLRCAQIVSIKSIRPAAKQRSAPGRFLFGLTRYNDGEVRKLPSYRGSGIWRRVSDIG
jgi:hypothetical protein